MLECNQLIPLPSRLRSGWQFFYINMASRAFVFIDGNNFYFKLKELSIQLSGNFHLIDFDFYGFSKNFVNPNILAGVNYYIGALKYQRNNPKSAQMYSDQQKLLAKIKNQGINITLGHIIQHPDKSFHEKGVDVRLAVEMIRFARENKYDTAYLLSSDTDLVPAVEEVHAFDKKVCYVGIAKGQSFGLTKTSDTVLLLRPSDIQQFL